jgi:hypothetical protein
MTEHPIIFSAEMVWKLLAGRKTQTRRPVKGMPEMPTPDCHPKNQQKHPAPYFDAYCGATRTQANPRGMTAEWCWWQVDDRQCLPTVKCPYGAPGDRLWVREAHALVPATAYRCSVDDRGAPIPHRVSPCGNWWAVYRADWERSAPGSWRPSIHMPRWASRITLEVVSVRCDWLQGITEDDAIAEGAPAIYGPLEGGSCPHIAAFMDVWQRIYGPGSWDADPLVWRVEFMRAT